MQGRVKVLRMHSTSCLDVFSNAQLCTAYEAGDARSLQQTVLPLIALFNSSPPYGTPRQDVSATQPHRYLFKATRLQDGAEAGGM